MYDLLVIGAGPAGSRVADRLGEKGCRVLVVERKEKLDEPVCCTGIIGSECVRSFDIDSNAVTRETKSARLFSPSNKCLRLYRQAVQAYVLDRGLFNIALARKAQAHGVEYALRSRVKEIEVGADKVKVSASSRGKEVTFEAKAAVIASGFGPGITGRLGLGEIGDFVIGAQSEVEVEGLDEIEVYIGREIAPGFFGWLVPTFPGRALVGLLSRRNPGLYLEGLISSLKRQGKILRAEAKPGYGVIPLKTLPWTYADRLLVVGDAAGQVKPLTGGGIYYGLLGADIAADTLFRALESGNFSSRSLSIYERRWKRRLAKELRIGYWARRLYERLNDGQIDRIFDIMNSNGIAEAMLKSEDLSFDWHGEAVLKVLGHAALAEAFGLIKLPLRLTGR